MTMTQRITSVQEDLEAVAKGLNKAQQVLQRVKVSLAVIEREPAIRDRKDMLFPNCAGKVENCLTMCRDGITYCQQASEYAVTLGKTTLQEIYESLHACYSPDNDPTKVNEKQYLGTPQDLPAYYQALSDLGLVQLIQHESLDGEENRIYGILTEQGKILCHMLHHPVIQR